MGTKREQFQRWLDEWKDYAWSCRDASEWPRMQFTDADIRDRAVQVLGRDEVTGLAGLAAVAEALTEHRGRLSRCQVFLGRELVALREAGGAWAGIAAWTMISESTVRTLVKAYQSRPAPAASGFDRGVGRVGRPRSGQPVPQNLRAHRGVGLPQPCRRGAGRPG